MGIRVEELIETAVGRVGSEDFGGDTWREGLDVLVNSLTTESALNELGESVMQDQIVSLLVNRLEVEEWFARYPEINEQEIVAPLFKSARVTLRLSSSDRPGAGSVSSDEPPPEIRHSTRSSLLSP